MALCVALQADGTLIPTGEAIEACTGYVLVSGSEHSFYQLVHQVFSAPDPETAAQWFVACASAPIVWFVVARVAGGVVSMFNSK